MESKKSATVQELRAVFAKSQLAGSSQESLNSSLDGSGVKSSSEGSESSPALFVETEPHKFSKNAPARRSPIKPTVSPKPSGISPGNKAGIKSLVSSLEGSGGMYTSKVLHNKNNAITLKDVRQNSETTQDDVKITSKLIEGSGSMYTPKILHKKSNASPTVKDARENSQVQDNFQVTSRLVKKETIVFGEQKNKMEDSLETNLKDLNGNENELSSQSTDNTEVKPTQEVSDKNLQSSQNIRNSIISVDNYVCKCNVSNVRRTVPSKEELGPAPPKPWRPQGMRLPLQETTNYRITPSYNSSSDDSLPPPVPDRNMNLLIRPPGPVPARPTCSIPKVPPPNPAPLRDEPEDLEEEEIYNDVIILVDSHNCVSPESRKECPNQDDEEDIYDDHTPQNFPPSLPRHPPPSPPRTTIPHDGSSLLQHPSSSALDQDSTDMDEQEGIYEEAPIGPEYVNKEEVTKEKKKRKKRSLKTEQKTLERIEKKREKFMKKFSLSGEEIPLDAGIVKNDSRGNKFDLSVFKGETVLILRMENNPSGKWLAKNEKGKVGYVELNNIEVDVESVKSVMTVRVSQTYGEEPISLAVQDNTCNNEA